MRWSVVVGASVSAVIDAVVDAVRCQSMRATVQARAACHICETHRLFFATLSTTRPNLARLTRP